MREGNGSHPVTLENRQTFFHWEAQVVFGGQVPRSLYPMPGRNAYKRERLEDRHDREVLQDVQGRAMASGGSGSDPQGWDYVP